MGVVRNANRVGGVGTGRKAAPMERSRNASMAPDEGHSTVSVLNE